MPTRRKLAELLLVTPAELRFLSTSQNLYRHFPAPKKDGSFRMIDDPCAQLKRAQKRIAKLLGRISPPDALFCPVKGRSYVGNAAVHRDGRVVHSLDVQKYFPSTTRRRIYWFFNTVMGCPEDVAGTLANLVCCDGHLATGSPASPILAYYAHIDVWEKVASLAKANGCVLSIYIDDITLSGPHVSKKLVWEVKECIHRAGLRYHKEKRSIDRACEVTGVIIDRTELKVPNRQHKKLREAKRARDRDRNSKDSAKIVGRLAGLQGQFDQIANGNVKRPADVG
nr:reverse transcriptase family protein [Hyphomicrobium methylovorum]